MIPLEVFFLKNYVEASKTKSNVFDINMVIMIIMNIIIIIVSIIIFIIFIYSCARYHPGVHHR